MDYPEDVKEEEIKIRTNQQSKAIHLFCKQVADALNNEGHTMQSVVKHINKMEIVPTKNNVKEIIWRTAQLSTCHTDSTTLLERKDIDKIYDAINMFLGHYFQIHVPFPSNDSVQFIDENTI
jgi:predicted transcriptional regulator